MTFEQYQIEAMRTFKDLGSREKNILHMECGMLTEAGELVDQIKKHFAYGKELDVVNLQEEWGDFMWYYANYLTIFKINFMPEYERKQEESRIYDKVKKLIKEKEFTEMEAIADFIVNNSNSLRHYMPYIGHLIGEPEKMLQMNIDKLRKRYPEKFDSNLAINRDTDAERVILEQHKH
jgi:NTP pyrophosphatase (non-canonical NTP hydrolase)